MKVLEIISWLEREELGKTSRKSNNDDEMNNTL